MKFVIIISVFTLTTAVRIPNTWQLDKVEDFKNLFIKEDKPLPLSQTFIPVGPSSLSNVNNYRTNIPNAGINDLTYNKNEYANLPVNWLPVVNKEYTFLTPPKTTSGNVLSINDPNFLNNLFNPQLIDGNGAKKKPYSQQVQVPPRFTEISGKNLNRKPTDLNPVINKGLPEEKQVQYITYTTQAPVPHPNTRTGRNTIRPVQNAQVSDRNTLLPFSGVDFNLNDPFPKNRQGNKTPTQNHIPQETNHQIADISAAQPAVNFDVTFNNPVFQNHPAVKINRNQQISPIALLSQLPVDSKPSNNRNNQLGTSRPLSNLDFDANNPFNKNYRDDKTHEPIPYDLHYEFERVPKIERLEHEKAPISDHEYAPAIPVRPIYPGAGQWAKSGIRHKPYISQHKYATLENSKEVPSGYDTFLEGQKLFDEQNRQFGQRLQEFPQKHQFEIFTNPNQKINNINRVNNNNRQTPRYQQQKVKENLNEESDSQEEDEDTFVPTKLYAQVRHSEDEEHLPPAADENGRLKELVKDSKIQTVYSEEGYEDSAYDHAGHEKNAENAEGFEKDGKEIIKKEQKNEPAKKYNLHIPQRDSAAYSKKDINLKEEDIQKLKEEALNLDAEDSETAGTQHEEKSYISKAKPPKKVYSARTKGFSKRKVATKVPENITEDGRPETLATIIKGNGTTEMEISSEVKVIQQPNNSTKSHKYIKIYPKVYKTRNNENTLKPNRSLKNGSVLNHVTTESPFTTMSPTESTEIYAIEIPSTTQATTAIPKIKDRGPDTLDKLEKNILKMNTKRRQKRFAFYFPKIEVDTGFIDGIKHELGKPKQKEDLTKIKYPYYTNYKEMGLHENSPLRYSEDLKHVPAKVEGKLAFYDQADTKKECFEVNPHVSPVPDRIKEADENPEEVEDATDVEELVKSPRLGKLGDKIDCFKVKYFGENPLDNPIFREELVGHVKPIFKEIEGITTEQTVVNKNKSGKRSTILNYRTAERQDTTKKNSVFETEPIKSATNYNDENAIEDDVLEKVYEKYVKNDFTYPKFLEKSGEEEENANTNSKKQNSGRPIDNKDIIGRTKNPKDDVETIDVTSKNTVNKSQKEAYELSFPTLITTPKYTIDLKPKHIYDQIELLQYLPVEDYLDITEKSTEKTVTKKPVTEKAVRENMVTEKIITEKKTTTTNLPKTNKTKKTKVKKTSNNTNLPRTNKVESTSDNTKRKASVQGKKRNSYGREAKEVKHDEKINKENSDGAISESLPEPNALKRRRRIKEKPKKPQYEIFDINQYLPKVPYPTPPHRDTTLSPRPISFGSAIPKAPVYEVFDINKFLPTTPFPLFPQSTVLPKYKVISEVFYKDDIKPNEQFNVFTDVINNIKKRQQDILHDSSEIVSVEVTKMPHKYMKDTYTNDDADLEGSNSFEVLISTTTTEPIKQRTRYKNHRTHETADEAQEQATDKLNHETSSKTNRRQKVAIRAAIVPTTIGSQYNLYKNHKISDSSPQVEVTEKTNKFPYKMNNTIKRRQRVKTTTAKVPVVKESISSTEEEQSTEVMGLVPPGTYGYKTIYNPKIDSEQYIVQDEAEEKIINKFLVPGMKPPPRQKVYSYSDFSTINHIRQSTGKSKRNKRNADRPAYANVSRNRGKQTVTEETDTKTDDDDYVPNRTRNYHYDEKTGKIVYDNKPKKQEEELEEEVEYIEIVDETPSTTAKPKQNPIFATATPPPEGQSYVDFVKLLKSASSYREIPDPTTTEKGKEETTEQDASSTTLKMVSTTPPEFLSILTKVRSDSNYKLIEDKKKTKTTTTTEPPESEEIIEEEEESQVENVKNSPGALGVVNGENFKLFDITDFLPKVKSYLPKTSVDTSKYKSIQRPTLKHNSTSRFNSEEEKDLQSLNTSKKQILDTDSKQYETRDTIEEIVTIPTSSTTTTTTATSTTKKSSTTVTTTTTAPTTEKTVTPKIIRNHHRRRTTTLRTTSTTREDLTTTSPPTTTTTDSEIHHDKVRRTYRRRNPRIKTTTTEKFLNGEMDDTTKIVRRRSETDTSILPVGSDNNEQIILEDHMDVPELLDQMNGGIEANYNENKETVLSEDNINDANSGKIVGKLVEIFKKYDQTKKHGGNYKNEEESKTDTNKLEQIQEHKFPLSAGNDDQNSVQTAIIANQNNDVDVFRNYDKSKKHGGNYRLEDEDISRLTKNKNSTTKITEPKKVTGKVEVFKKYDNNKKHDDTYNSNTENTSQMRGQEEPEPDLERIEDEKNKNVEIFKNYNNTEKHGGNYKLESDGVALVNEQQSEESRFMLPKDNQKESNIPEIRRSNEIEILKAYDKNKKHGGNYKSEDEAVTRNKNNASNFEKDVKQSKIKQPVLHLNKVKDIEIFNNYDKNQKHGGNYKYENVEDTKGAKIEETKYSKLKPHDGKVQRTNSELYYAHNLANSVLKPESFYTDPKLPVIINGLKIVNSLSNDELEEIVASAEKDNIDEQSLGDDTENEEKENLDYQNMPASATFGNKVMVTSEENNQIPTTAKPLFIKDPSKRLYYYAPVR